jgi:thiol-disulfide isomerase/thioredoxin
VIAGLAASAAALLAATLAGLTWRARNGRIRVQHAYAAAPAASSAHADATAITARDLGAELGSTATLVQFSTAFCAPCRATRQILSDVAGMVDGVRHVEIDAESRLDLVRRLDIRRTPTTFVLGPQGQITHRASGQPRKADVIAALGVVV